MSDTIGARWKEVLNRCGGLMAHADLLDDHELEFLKDMARRLQIWGTDTFVSAKQLNWITALEYKINQEIYK